MTAALSASLRTGLEAMATYASAPMDLWDRFSNDVLKAADLLDTPTAAAGPGASGLAAAKLTAQVDQAPPAEHPPTHVLVPDLETLRLFLNGEGPLDGKWFGELHDTLRGAFWWRKYLPLMLLSAPTGGEGSFAEDRSVGVPLSSQPQTPSSSDGSASPEPPWPIGNATNCKRKGWTSFFDGKDREACPYPLGRRDLQIGYRVGWDAAQAHFHGDASSEGGLPADVVRLVIAARHVAFEDHPGKEELRELDAASEAFAARVPWDDEP